MKGQTVADHTGGGIMAIAPDPGLRMLARAVPPEIVAAAMVGAVTIKPGERFAVDNGVAIVPVRGILTPNSEILERWLGWATYAGLTRTMEELAAREDVRAVAMIYDSPGGNVLLLESAGAAVRSCAAVKPVHAVVDVMAASAAYYLASQCTEITLAPGAWVGSIGTMSVTADYVAPGHDGAQLFVQTSSHARAKAPTGATEEGRALVQRAIDAMEAEFHAVVAAGRGIDPAELRAKLSVTEDEADGGAVFWGSDAVRRGLADRIEPTSAAMARIARAYAAKRPAPRAMGAAAQAAAARARAAI